MGIKVIVTLLCDFCGDMIIERAANIRWANGGAAEERYACICCLGTGLYQLADQEDHTVVFAVDIDSCAKFAARYK